MTDIFLNRKNNELSDLHIHPRPDCTSIEILNQYVNLCIHNDIRTIGFVEHGKRNNGHKGVLEDIDIINQYISTCKLLKEYWKSSVKIFCGIELDYFHEKNEDYNEIIYSAGFDFIIGSIHGINVKKYENYLDATINMLEKYRIDILGHMQFIDEINIYKEKIEKIFKILKKNYKI